MKIRQQNECDDTDFFVQGEEAWPALCNNNNNNNKQTFIYRYLLVTTAIYRKTRTVAVYKLKWHIK